MMPTRVLLVEDDTLTRRNIAIYLRRSQIEVDEAANGEEAVRLITSIDKYDVLVSDLRMPGMTDGMDVITCQQRVSPGTSCILVTSETGASAGCGLPGKARFPGRLLAKIARLAAPHTP